MSQETREPMKEQKEEIKKSAAYYLYSDSEWDIEEIASAVDRPVIWVIQTLKGQGIDVKT